MARERRGSVEAFSKHYSAMSNDELACLTADIGSLVPNARESLRAEMELRGVPVGNVDWTVQAAPAKTERFYVGLRRFFCILLILVGCRFCFALLRLSALRGLSALTIVGAIFDGAAGFTVPVNLVFAALVAQRFVPRKPGTRWGFGFIVQLTAILLLAVMGLFRLESSVERIIWLAAFAWIVYSWWRDRHGSDPALQSSHPTPEAGGELR